MASARNEEDSCAWILQFGLRGFFYLFNLAAPDLSCGTESFVVACGI